MHLTPCSETNIFQWIRISLYWMGEGGQKMTTYTIIPVDSTQILEGNPGRVVFMEIEVHSQQWKVSCVHKIQEEELTRLCTIMLVLPRSKWPAVAFDCTAANGHCHHIKSGPQMPPSQEKRCSTTQLHRKIALSKSFWNICEEISKLQISEEKTLSFNQNA